MGRTIIGLRESRFDQAKLHLPEFGWRLFFLSLLFGVPEKLWCARGWISGSRDKDSGCLVEAQGLAWRFTMHLFVELDIPCGLESTL